MRFELTTLSAKFILIGVATSGFDREEEGDCSVPFSTPLPPF